MQNIESNSSCHTSCTETYFCHLFQVNDKYKHVCSDTEIKLHVLNKQGNSVLAACMCVHAWRCRGFGGHSIIFFPALFETLALVRRIWKQFLWDVLLAVCWKPISSFKHTKQMRFSFSYKGRCRTWRVTPLRSRCYRATFKANANGHHSDTPWTQSGSLPRTLRPRTQRKKKKKNTAQTSWDTLLRQEQLRAMEIHELAHSHRKWISVSCWLSGRQIVCL